MVVLRHSRSFCLIRQTIPNLPIHIANKKIFMYYNKRNYRSYLPIERKICMSTTKKQLIEIIEHLSENEAIFVLEFLKRILRIG